MPDSLALSVIAIVAAALVALALVWPQGEGKRSPAPFGHPLAAIEQPGPPPAPAKPETLRGPQAPAVAPRTAKAAHAAAAPR
jgi:hypothetical protein